jgi:hypothetical protein
MHHNVTRTNVHVQVSSWRDALGLTFFIFHKFVFLFINYPIYSEIWLLNFNSANYNFIYNYINAQQDENT